MITDLLAKDTSRECSNRSSSGRHCMKQSTKNRAKGNYHELKGKVKQKVGEATNNPRLQAEGIGEKLAGKIQKKIGRVEEAIERP